MTFEATLEKGAFWKKVVEAMKDLVSEANFECTGQGISIQSVDVSHVALVSLTLGSRGFDTYSCHRNQILGVNLNNLSKLLKVTDDKDSLTLRHPEDSDALTIESQDGTGKRSIEFTLKLMEIEQDAMGVPDTDMDYKAVLSMPSDVFAKTCRDMATFGDNMSIDISKESVKFQAAGDLGEGCITIQSQGPADKAPAPKSNILKGEPGVKPEAVKSEVKKEVVEDDENQVVGDVYPDTTKKATKTKDMTQDGIYISCSESMQLTFALRYLATFAKGAALSDRVTLSLSHEQPCRVEFLMNGGSLRWFLAPKVDDDTQGN